MKLTIEKMKQYNASSDLINYVKDNAFDNLEMDEVLSNASLELLYFIKQYFYLTDTEQMIYDQRCMIHKCYNCFSSKNIDKSSYIKDSVNVINSDYILRSSDIVNSNHVFDSTQITDSSFILDSKAVYRSNAIVNSNNIEFCGRLCNVDKAEWSNYIMYSRIVDNSSYCVCCTDIVTCSFSNFLESCHHCLFCSGLRDPNMHNKSFHIFNNPVPEQEFYKVLEQVNNFVITEQSTFLQVLNTSPNVFEKPTITLSLIGLIDGFSDEFYDWAKTIPNYSEEIFKQIFFLH